MVESRPVPSTILSWIALKDLVPDHKLFAVYLWFNRFTNACGCYELPLAMAEVELNIKENALFEALSDFRTKGLLDYDEKTGEVYIEAWLKFHKFNNAIQRQMYWSSVGKITSDRLCSKVYDLAIKRGIALPNEKSNGYVPTVTGTVTATGTKPSARGSIPVTALKRLQEIGYLRKAN